RRAEQGLGPDVALGQYLPDLLLGHPLAGQGAGQVQTGQAQGGAGQPLRPVAQSAQQPDQHGDQQRYAVQRIDDEHRGPGHRRRLQRPKQLRAVAGEGVQQGMGDQHQPDGQEQAACRVGRVGPPAAHQQGKCHGQQAEHQQRMAETTVVGRTGHGVAVVDDHVKVGQSAEHGAVEQGAAALPAPEQGALHGGAEYRLGERIHKVFRTTDQAATLAPGAVQGSREFPTKDFSRAWGYSGATAQFRSPAMHPRAVEITERPIERSRGTRQRHLAMSGPAAEPRPRRPGLPCATCAHALAGCSGADKQTLRLPDAANVAIVSAYNDMLSAHQPYADYPQRLKAALHEIGSVGQMAGGVPAMCDGVTQGEPGMEIGLASREVIAMSTAVALSHNLFDAALCLGICDKIVPGLLIGALRFGHLPTLFVPAGPMTSGLSNKDKAAVRERFAEGKASRDELLESEMKAYHSPGTCTFYGTANTNQMLMEVMGLHLPGAS